MLAVIQPITLKRLKGIGLLRELSTATESCEHNFLMTVMTAAYNRLYKNRKLISKMSAEIDKIK